MMQAQCRFCGVDTKKNKYLFDKANLEYVKMAMTIYPVVIHPSDPLPKYVCDVCQLNICKEYESRQSTIALNNQWINNLRRYEPQHGYLSLLDTIEDIKKLVIENNKLEVKGLLKQCVARILCYEKTNLNQEELNNSKSSSSKERQTNEENNDSSSKTKIEDSKQEILLEHDKKKTSKSKSSITKQHMKPWKDKLDVPMTSTDADDTDPIDSITSEASVAIPAATTTSNTNMNTSKKLSDIKSIFSKKSGCTFVTYGGTTIKIKTMPKIPASRANDKPTKNLTEADDHQQKVKRKSTEKTNTNLTQTCNICQHLCTSKEDLVFHQTKEHLNLKLRRVFQKKTLPSSFRRGRVMKVDDEQSVLRCLSCYRVYENNEEILEHWTNCKCDFYCLICNESYPESPKVLREHVRQKHHVNHNQLRLLHENNNEEGTTEVTPVPVTIRRTVANAKCSTCCRVFVTKEAREEHMLTHQPNYIRKEQKPEVPTKIQKEKTAKCKSCSKVFEHARALNGHMRIHKQTNNYGSLTLPTNNKNNMVDKYMENEVEPEIVVKNETIAEEKVVIGNNQSPHKEQLPINTNFDINSSSSTSSTIVEKQKGFIKVKAMHELMQIHPPPTKHAKLEPFGNWQ